MAGAILISLYAIRSASLDAIPDISDPQLVIYAKWARSPEQLESRVTEPLVRSLMGAPEIKAIRATSHLGYSFIYVILHDLAQREKVRQSIHDAIRSVRSQLPTDAIVTLGPNASSMGWIFQYALIDRTGTRDLREMRIINETRVKPALLMVPGVAEVASVGGLERQIELKIFPPLLEETGISLRQLEMTLKNAFQQVGGRTIEITNREYQIRGLINSDNIDKLEYIVIGQSTDGGPVLLKDIGYLQVNYDIRRSIADLDGEGEVVGAIVIMEQDQNVISVSALLKNKLDTIKNSLPSGIEIITTYDRSGLIWKTLKNFSTALGWELFVVMVVIVLALRNHRATIAPLAVILLGSLFTILPLSVFGQTINLLSLAGLAIAIGEMADATIVIVENCTTELNRHDRMNHSEKIETIIQATARLTRPLLFSLLIILASFLPVFFLGEREARLFNPLAYSKTFAMGFSTLLTLFFLPIIIMWVFDKDETRVHGNQDNIVVRVYRQTLRATIRHRYLFLFFNIILLIIAVMVLRDFERDYMPEMEEGSLLYMPTTLPGLPTREAAWILQKMDKKLKQFPEVSRVFGKLGRADTATDPAPTTMIETTILLKPKSEWRAGMTKNKLVDEMDEALKIIGYVNSWTQPIAARVIMQDTGIQTPVGIKVKGSAIPVIEEISRKIEGLLREYPGTASVIAERISEGYYLNVENDLELMAKEGIIADEAILTVRYAIGGENIVDIRQSDNTVVPLSMQFSPEYIDTLDKVRRTPVMSLNGRTVPLDTISDVSVEKMPEMIRNDNGETTGYIYIDVRDITPIDYVEGAKSYLKEHLKLPSGYTVEWTGSYQYAEEAQSRLRWIVPITMVIILILLLMAFKSVAKSILILLSAPFALIGGVALQWILGYPITTAVVIGYIAVLAVAIQTGIIMIEFIHDSLRLRTDTTLYTEAVITGSVARLRPKLMTVATTVLGLIPILFSTGSGMDIAKPIAVPTIGGMLTSTIYVLFLIPCFFVIGKDFINYWSGVRG